MLIKKKTVIFLDSGIGGISILKNINKFFKNIKIIYFMDNLKFPYGNKNYLYITKRIYKIIKYLNKIYYICMLILACNTASVISLNYLKKKFKFPIIGTFPSIKTSFKKTKKKIILLIGTYLTINSSYINNFIKKYLPKDIKIIKKYSSELVYQSELKIKKNKINIKKINNIFKKEKKIKNLDTIIIGCTHYNFLIKEIKKIFNKKIYFIKNFIKIKKKYIIFLKKIKTKYINQKKYFFYTKKKKDIFLFIKNIRKIYKFSIFKKIKI